MISAGARVEVAGRLVGQQDFGLVYQRPGDGHPLLLAAGKLPGLVGGPLLQPDGPQRLQRRFPDFGTIRIDERQFHVFQGADPRQQVKGLKDKSDFLIADLGQFVAVQAADFPAVQNVGPPLGRSRSPMMFIRVDFPDPEGPTTATNSPGPISRETSLSAFVCPLPFFM